MSRPLTKELTDKQRQKLDWISAFTQRHGMPPTVREIGDAFGIASSSTFAVLRALQRKGYLQRGDLGARSLKITSPHQHAFIPCRSVPIIGQIAAGAPLFATETDMGSLPVNTEWLQDRDCYALRVKGDSMIDAAIQDGDYVIVRQQDHARDGDIVVALIGGEEATVKYFYREASHIRLQPANKTMKPIYVQPSDLRIQGRVIGVHRNYGA